MNDPYTISRKGGLSHSLAAHGFVFMTGSSVDSCYYSRYKNVICCKYAFSSSRMDEREGEKKLYPSYLGAVRNDKTVHG